MQIGMFKEEEKEKKCTRGILMISLQTVTSRKYVVVEQEQNSIEKTSRGSTDKCKTK